MNITTLTSVVYVCVCGGMCERVDVSVSVAVRCMCVRVDVGVGDDVNDVRG